MKNISRVVFPFLLALLAAVPITAQRDLGSKPTGSGGVVPYEQEAYDVKVYDITAKIDPAAKSISGTTIITAEITSPVDWFVVDLDTPLTVSEVTASFTGRDDNRLKFERREGKIWIKFPMTVQAGETVRVAITYSGKPRVAPRPPWVGGFIWEKTADGSDWISNACQNDGADCWIPVKDYPSDKPDSVALHITVPGNLYVASIGRLQEIVSNLDGTLTYNWLMSTPISNYEIVLNIAPYQPVEDTYKSVGGETIPIIFYALPESKEKAQSLIDETKKYLAFYEQYLGPYPFRTEKLGIAETSHLGMEHSTIIAYGNKFEYNEMGFDWLMLHEFGHEWWANLVTCWDWRDMWIHEGFQSFMDSLYVEKVAGKEAYMKSMQGRMRGTRNKQPVAPRDAKITFEIYMQAPDYTKGDGDIYGKGAVVLHSLRYLIGDEAFFRALRRMAYPTKEMESKTDGSQVRFATTDDFLYIAEQESGMDLDWFFEVYLRQPELPELVADRSGSKLKLSWKTPGGLPFRMPVDVSVNGKTSRVEMKNGSAELAVPDSAEFSVDPEGWVFRKQ